MVLNGKKILRWITSALLVATIVALAGLAVMRARQKRPSQTELDADQIFGDTGSSAVGVSNEFKYVEQVEGRMIFALEALRTLGKSSGWYDIEGVAVQLFGDDESMGPMLSCKNASFNIDTKDAQLTGSVQVEFPDGAFFSTEIGMLLGGGRRFESGTSVTFVGQEVFGRAGAVNYDMTNEVLQLSDGVVIRTDGRHSLTTPTIEYRRRKGLLSLPQGGTMVFGGVTLTAPFGRIELKEGEQLPQKVIFSGGVTISGTDQGTDQSLRAWAERIEAERDADNRWQIHATTSGPWVNVEFFGGDNVLFQGLRTWDLKAVADKEGLLNMVADKGVCLENVSPTGERRVGEAKSLRVWFDEGQTSDVELQKEVVIRDEGVVATAYRARVDALNEKVMLQGNPIGRSNRVSLVSDKGRLVADQALLSREDGMAEARGRVQGEMYGVSLAGGHQGGTEEGETVHIACGMLTMSNDGGEYHLRDSARAWQGQRLLAADEIKYLPEQRTMEARGHARTTFPASMLDPGSKTAEDVVLSARSITFDDARSRAVYQGDVVYRDARQTMSAALLEVEIEDGDVRSVVATGSVEIQSFETGQKLTGSRVVHDVASGDFHLTGEPAQAIDESGNMLSGRSLTFNQASGRVSVADETETIYHPEEEP